MKVINAQNLNVFDLLTKDLIVVTRQALELISSRLMQVAGFSSNAVNKQSGDSWSLAQQGSLYMSAFGKVDFPDTARVGETYELEVHAETVEKEADLTSFKVDVWILVSSDDFELQSPEVQTLEIAPNSKNTSSISFKLIPKQIGNKAIKVDFLQGTRYLGRKELSTIIEYSGANKL